MHATQWVGRQAVPRPRFTLQTQHRHRGSLSHSCLRKLRSHATWHLSSMQGIDPFCLRQVFTGSKLHLALCSCRRGWKRELWLLLWGMKDSMGRVRVYEWTVFATGHTRDDCSVFVHYLVFPGVVTPVTFIKISGVRYTDKWSCVR